MARKGDGQGDAGLPSPAIWLCGSLSTDRIRPSFPSHALCCGRALARGEARWPRPFPGCSLMPLLLSQAFRPLGKNLSPHQCSRFLRVFLLSITFSWNVCHVGGWFQKALGTLLIVNDFCVFKSLELSPITCVFNPVGQEAMGRASELSSRAASSPVSQVKWKLGLKATNI